MFKSPLNFSKIEGREDVKLKIKLERPKDPKSNNFMMVMEYAKDGSLREYLNNMLFNSIKQGDKLNILHRIANGLNSIHKEGLIHRDFHCDNMLKDGLCQPADVKSSQNEYEKQVYGVLSYIAPEVLRGKEYTQKTISICQGLRPKSNYKFPQLILDIIKQISIFEVKKQFEEAERINEKFTSTSLPYNDDDNSIGEYSESIEAIDFTKLN
ncbi:kinase-like domain-containing protein [Rhizophagus diaphanus]|nr:kinase-like domain-containing protein [Rhizophagus diaphanus] [Rhizophagus sp. MUCL 43196]